MHPCIGSDYALLRLVQEALEIGKWPSSVLTGKTPFVVDDDNERHAGREKAGHDNISTRL